MKTTKLHRRSIRHEEGSILVETAMVLPLLLLLVLGIIDIAGLIRAKQVVSNAAREGARLSTLMENKGKTGSGPNTIVSTVQDYITTKNKVSCTATPTVVIDQDRFIPTPSGVSMSSSLVVVTCPFKLNFLPSFTAGAFPTTVNLTGQSEFRNLY